MKFSNIKILVLAISLILSLSGAFSAQPAFTFEGDYNYALNRSVNDVFSITPDGSKAVTLTSVSNQMIGGQITSFNPVTGTKFDTEFVGFGPSSVKLINLNDGIRVAVITTNGGPRSVTIYDMDSSGMLTFRVRTQLTDSGADTDSNMVLSAAARAGFVRVTQGNFNQLVSFSLDTGGILNRLNVFTSSLLNMYEDATRRIIVSGGNRQLNFIDATNPLQLQSLGNVMLPATGTTFGSGEMATVFSADGQYVFAGSGFALLSSINTVTREVVDSLDDTSLRANKLRIFENGNTRLLAMRSIEDEGGFKGFSIINASNPANLALVNQLSLGSEVFSKRDFVFSRDGKRLIIAADNKLTVLSVPQLSTVFENALPTSLAFRVETFGQPERILGAWGSNNNFTSTIYSIPNRTNRLANFDSDAKTDLSVFRPSNGTWYWLNSSNNNFVANQFGASGDVPVAADYDGDDITDLAVFRPDTFTWYIFESSTGGVRVEQFGLPTDELVPADYDGDKKVDIAVFRRNANRWIILQSGSGTLRIQKFGFGRGKPVVGDFDGDGRADFAYFNSAGVWQILNSGAAAVNQPFGLPGDIPISGDFDNDGRADLAIFRPGENSWYIQQSFSGFRVVTFGLNTDKLVPADYDGDGKTDIAVFRPGEGVWYILQSTNNFTRIVQFGLGTDIPVPLQK